MISAVESKIGVRKRFYKNLKKIGENLYQLKILDLESYFQTLNHIKNFSVGLKTSFRKAKNKNEAVSLIYFYGLIEEILVFNELKESTIKNIVYNIIDELNYIINDLPNISFKESNDTRGLITEIVAYSWKFDHEKNSEFVWDVVFYKDEEPLSYIKEGFISKSLDFYKEEKNHIELCECKTTPYTLGVNKSQIGFLVYICELFRTYNANTSAKVFFLENKENPKTKEIINTHLGNEDIQIECFDEIQFKV